MKIKIIERERESHQLTGKHWEKRESRAARFWLMGEEGKLGGKNMGFGFRIFYFITKVLKCLKSGVLVLGNFILLQKF